MTLVNPKPLGYAYGEVLPSGHVNSIWSQLTDAIDGTGGGTYELTAPLNIAGSGVTIDELYSTIFAATTLVATTATIGEATFTGAAAFQGDVTLGNSVADIVTLNGIVAPTGGGRVRESAHVITTTGSSVDIALIRNIDVTYAGASTTTLTGTVADDDWVVIQNTSGNVATFNGLISDALSNNTGAKFVRVSGTYRRMSRWAFS